VPGSNCVKLRIETQGVPVVLFTALETLEPNQKQKMHSLNGATLTPAYGRDYTSGKDAIASFESGKDFSLASVFHGSGYVSCRDFVAGDRVSIRYGKLRKVVGHVVKGGVA
jgi:hypothetical protein